MPPFVPEIVPGTNWVCPRDKPGFAGLPLCKVRRKPGFVPGFHRVCPRDKPGEIPGTNPGSSRDLQPPRPAAGVSRALRARSVPRESPRVSPNTGVSEGSECSGGCLRGPLGPGLWSAQKVSRECPRSVFLHPRAYSRDTSGPKGPRDSCSRSGGVATRDQPDKKIYVMCLFLAWQSPWESFRVIFRR